MAGDAKYELTDETVTINDYTLHRIRALQDIPRYGVKAGDLGGFVKSKMNLSHEGDCWIGDDACVYEETYVSNGAFIGGHAILSGDTHVSGNAVISGNAHISISVAITDDAEITETSHVLFIGPAGPEYAKDYCLAAYRLKGGGYCIKFDDRHDFLFGHMSAIEIVSNHRNSRHDSKYKFMSDNFRFLTEMARSHPEEWPNNEYRFMIEMIRIRAEDWESPVKPDGGAEKERHVTRNHVSSAPKYKLTDETRIIDGRILYRIRALRDISESHIITGCLGGFIESEANLSHEGSCWVGDDACVYEGSHVSEDAIVNGGAYVAGYALVNGSSRISGKARVTGYSFIHGPKSLQISGNPEITDPLHVLFMGPIGPDNQYLTAYRTKGGGCCIEHDINGKSVKSMLIEPGAINDNKENKKHDNKYRLLLDMARDESGEWEKNEYSFMIEMARCRAMQWKLQE